MITSKPASQPTWIVRYKAYSASDKTPSLQGEGFNSYNHEPTEADLTRLKASVITKTPRATEVICTIEAPKQENAS